MRTYLLVLANISLLVIHAALGIDGHHVRVVADRVIGCRPDTLSEAAGYKDAFAVKRVIATRPHNRLYTRKRVEGFL